MNKEEVVKGLKWILEGDRFGFGVNWAEDCGTTQKDDEEQAGYNIQRAIDYIELLYDQNEKEWKKNPEVVRCKDCKYGERCKNTANQDCVKCNKCSWQLYGTLHLSDGLCANGERK